MNNRWIKDRTNYLFEQDKLLWQRELHWNPAFLHEHRFDAHCPLQLHFVTPCPPVIESLATAARNDWKEVSGTSATRRKRSAVGSNWFREYQFGNSPSLVPILKEDLKIKICKNKPVKAIFFFKNNRQNVASTNFGTINVRNLYQNICSNANNAISKHNQIKRKTIRFTAN